jgi:hypothetical protein
MENTKKFARICTATGEGMNEGWFINDNYFKYKKDADAYSQTIPNEENPENGNYKNFDELYNSLKEEDNDFCYWTIWDNEDEIFLKEFEEGAQNRFRNNDFRSFEEWIESKIENLKNN